MDDVIQFLSQYNSTVQAISLELREMVLSIMPDANEVVTGHKNISYSTDAGQMKGGMVYIAPLKNSVNLGFIDGVDLPDPQVLLKGTGKRLRHIKFKSVEDLRANTGSVRMLIAAAVDHKN